MINYFNQRRRSGFDRRTGEDRRKSVSLDYFLDHPFERRRSKERRRKSEMRDGWARVTRWSSAPKTLRSGKERPPGHETHL